MSVTDFQHRLLNWYEEKARDLPWRESRDPYPVMVSEFMLQQTTVAAVVPYFRKWMELFPTVESLAGADEDQVMQAWAGLGYYSRCRRLKTCAEIISRTGWPIDAAGLRGLPGIGAYTSAAIASIAFGEAVPCVDGNVERVYSRLAADSSAGARLRTNAAAWGKSVIVKERPGDWNQAVMELGATVCRPRSPDCQACPVSAMCTAFRIRSVDTFPAQKDRSPVIMVKHIIWIPKYAQEVGFVKSVNGEWWQGLWGFPRTDASETLGSVNESELLTTFNHTVTNHLIHVEVRVFECSTRAPEFLWMSPTKALSELALSAPQKRAVKSVITWLASRQPSEVYHAAQEAVDCEQGQGVQAQGDNDGQYSKTMASGEPLLAAKTFPS